MAFHAWRSVRALLTLCALSLVSCWCAEIVANFQDQTRELSVACEGLEPGTYEIRIDTSGLRDPERGSDLNEPGIIYLPPAAGPVRLGDRVDVSGAEMFLFFNSLEAGSGWELVVD